MGLDNYLSTQSLPNMSEGHNENWYEGARRDSGFSSGNSSCRNTEESEDDISGIEKEVIEEGEEAVILKLKVKKLEDELSKERNEVKRLKNEKNKYKDEIRRLEKVITKERVTSEKEANHLYKVARFLNMKVTEIQKESVITKDSIYWEMKEKMEQLEKEVAKLREERDEANKQIKEMKVTRENVVEEDKELVKAQKEIMRLKDDLNCYEYNYDVLVEDCTKMKLKRNEEKELKDYITKLQEDVKIYDMNYELVNDKLLKEIELKDDMTTKFNAEKRRLEKEVEDQKQRAENKEVRVVEMIKEFN